MRKILMTTVTTFLFLIHQTHAQSDGSIPPGWSLSPEYLQQQQQQQQQKHLERGSPESNSGSQQGTPDESPSESAAADDGNALPTLLETFVFLQYGNVFDIDELKENSPGVLRLPDSPKNPKPNQQWLGCGNCEEIWSVKDFKQCILRMDNQGSEIIGYDKRIVPYHNWVEYYLNNVSEDYFSEQDGYFLIKLFGENGVRCGNFGPKPVCYDHFYLKANTNEMGVRYKRALEYIYTNFCHFAQHSKKPF
jgi:hypothetical protein